ncbi:Aldehyde dehydrogenase [Leucoagaricus sp. SymC.cos]|nr:Aldehyde dehydrogenase [Leucoagaricus sp. SymC.cos]
MVKVYTHKFDTKVYKANISVKTGLFIDGQWVNPVDGSDMIKYVLSLYIVDSATRKVITAVSGSGEKDVEIAVKAARKAFKTTWGLKVPGSEQGRILSKLADLLEKHSDELAAFEALNVGEGSGKPFLLTQRYKVPCSVKIVRYYAGWADKIHGQMIETNEKKLAYTRHEPWGVVGAIVPWNVPLVMSKIAPALATGNTVILKPSEITPLTALFLADLLNEAGVPPGVVNVVNGYGHTVGSALSTHPNINKITFTGSTLTGRQILKAAAESNLKDVTLELGGKSPTIVFDDVDLDQAIKWATHGIFYNMGQICIAGSRIYVQEGVYDKFLEGFTTFTQGLTNATGNPFEAKTRHGPQVSKTQFDVILPHISSGQSEGAKVHIGGVQHSEEGYFVKPTVFVDAKPSMKIMREEIFGPVCSIVRFKTEELMAFLEVIEWANDTAYGLAANVLSENSARAIRMAHALEAGTIFVNSALVGDINVPFGGYKQSGIGRELGEAALKTYTQVKAVHINIGQIL